MWKLKRILVVNLAALSLLFVGAAPALVLAADPCSQSGLTAQQALACGASNGKSTTPDSTATKTLGDTITSVINILSAAVAVVAVIMIVLGGFRYVTSGGNQESISGAKKTILFAVVGLIITALAQIIVQFVLNKTTTASP